MGFFVSVYSTGVQGLLEFSSPWLVLNLITSPFLCSWVCSISNYGEGLGLGLDFLFKSNWSFCDRIITFFQYFDSFHVKTFCYIYSLDFFFSSDFKNISKCKQKLTCVFLHSWGNLIVYDRKATKRVAGPIHKAAFL